MQVEFQRTGERRYGVIIHRDALPPLEMNPAPGFDAFVPHDLMHFLVEQELGLRKGIFGQLAAGGTAGTFHPAQTAAVGGKTAARQRRSTKTRGKKLLEAGTSDCALSESATYICLYDWFAHSTDARQQARAAEMKPTAASILARLPADESRLFNEKFLARMRQRLDDISRRWSALETGQSIRLDWQQR